MPSSEKRIAANRANAQLSTGPKSPIGRRNSSRNAMKHGIVANAILIDGESREAFLELIAELEKEHKPATPTEYSYVRKMAVSQWRTLRTWTVEAAGIIHEMRRQANANADQDAPTRAMLAMRTLGDNSRQSELMSRYEHRFDIQHHRAMQDLFQLQEKARRAPVPVAREMEKSRTLVEKLAPPNQAMLSPENKEPGHET